MLCLFGITRDTIIHAMDLSHGLLSFCPREGLCSDLKLHIQIFQDMIFTSLLKLVSCFPGSGLPVHPVCLERALSPWKGTSSPREGCSLMAHFQAPPLASGNSSVPAREKFRPCTSDTDSILRHWSAFADFALEGRAPLPKLMLQQAKKSVPAG